MKLPPITLKQQTILHLLYRHRFINRIQVQELLNHKDKRRISSWLKDLREKEYIDWIYDSQDFNNKTKPAVYYLKLNGLRYLRSTNQYPSSELRKRYNEASKKQSFIMQCLLLNDCCLNLKAKTVGDISFCWILKPDYLNPDNAYNFLEDLSPNACFIKQEKQQTANYIFEIFPESAPHYILKKRIKDYVTFLDEAVWETESGDDLPPIIQLAFAKKTDLAYAKRRVKIELMEIYDDEIPDEFSIRFTTIEHIKATGITSTIWEELSTKR